MSEKRYYWLKLKDDFFGSLRIKKLRRLAGGDTYTIIYLKLQLLAIKDEGMVRWKGVEDNVVDELALELDEEPENVSVTLQYLLSTGLAETADNKDFFFPWAIANTGSETGAAQRMRDSRARKELCNNVTPALQARYTEKEIEIEKDTEIEIDTTASPPVSPPKEAKKKFGEYGWVRLTAKQYEKLKTDLGEEELARCIQYVDESAQKNHNKNKWTDWNLVVRNCHRDGWHTRNKRRGAEYQQKPMDLEALRKAVDSI